MKTIPLINQRCSTIQLYRYIFHITSTVLNRQHKRSLQILQTEGKPNVHIFNLRSSKIHQFPSENILIGDDVMISQKKQNYCKNIYDIRSLKFGVQSLGFYHYQELHNKLIKNKETSFVRFMFLRIQRLNFHKKFLTRIIIWSCKI